jgi:hypothetical protein
MKRLLLISALVLLLSACDSMAEPTPYKSGDLYGSFWCAAGSSTCYGMIINANGQVENKLGGSRKFFELLFRDWTAITKADLPQKVKLAAYREMAR